MYLLDSVYFPLAIIDVNNNNPTFKDCNQYSRNASVREGKHNKAKIIRVSLFNHAASIEMNVLLIDVLL